MPREPEKGRLHGIATGYGRRRDPKPPVAEGGEPTRPAWVDECVKSVLAAERRLGIEVKGGAP